MNKSLDLRELERKAWTSFHQDGAIETYVGVLLIIGFITSGDSAYLRIIGPVLILAAIGVFAGIKKLVTVPRMGLVKFGSARRARSKRLAIIMAVPLLATLVLFFMTATGTGPAGWTMSRTVFGLGLGIGIWLVFATIAFLSDQRRLYAVGFVMAASIASRELLDRPLMYLLGGGLLLVYGLTLFVRFIRQYPQLTNAELSGLSEDQKVLGG